MWLVLLIWSVSFSPAQAPAQDVAADLKLRLVEEINRDRKQAGLPGVEFSEELSRAADAHCGEMLREKYASHWNRAGWKPYLRYAQAGIRDATSENVASQWSTDFPTSAAALRDRMLESHRRFMAEEPPHDAHRRSVLDPNHTHVGIGVAHDERGMSLIEVFGARYVALEAHPLRTHLRATVTLKGKVLASDAPLYAVSIFYEPPPEAMSPEQLNITYSYSLPNEDRVERPRLELGRYMDGTQGTIVSGATGEFTLPLTFWKKQPGVYTVAVWVRRAGKSPFVGAMTSVIVEP